MIPYIKRCRQGRLRQLNPKKQAPGRRRPYAQVRVIKAPRVQLATEFDRISELPTSCQQQPNLPSTLGLATPPSQPRPPHQFHSRGSRQPRCVTRNDEGRAAPAISSCNPAPPTAARKAAAAAP